MSKFKVGDKVVGNKEASNRYGLTIEGWKGEVVKLYKDDITVKGLPGSCFGTFLVNSRYFDLLEPIETPSMPIF